MDIDAIIAEYQAIKFEQKVRRLEYAGPDILFYALPTEVVICEKLESLKAEINRLFKK